jgi:hypothetical protein
VIGPSSEFISAASEFIQENKTPLNVIFHSDEMSRSFFNVTNFDSQDNYDTGMNYWKMGSVGGINSFFSTETSPTPDSLLTVDFRPMIRKAKNYNLFEVDADSNYVEQMNDFIIRVPDSHISTIFLGGNPLRPGYIIETGDDENDIFDLDQRRAVMHVHTNEISRESRLYYLFSADTNSSIPSTGLYGVDVKVIKQKDVPADAFILS